MTKKIKVLLIIIAFSVLSVGCGSTMVELTPEQSAIISEYAVDLLLKYNKNSKSRILSEQEIAAAEEKQRIIEEEAKQREARRAEEQKIAGGAAGGAAVEEVVQDVNIAEFLGLNNFSIEYQSYEIVDSYPSDGSNDMFLATDATDGNQLMVLHFNIVNQSQGAEICDVLSKSIRTSIKVNGGNWKNSLVTLLDNEFSGFQDMIEAGNSQDTVLIVELPSDELSAIENIVLHLTASGESVKIGLE